MRLLAAEGMPVSNWDIPNFRLGSPLAPKPVSKGRAGIGGYAHSNDLLELGGIAVSRSSLLAEVLRSLAGVSAGDQEIHARRQSAIPKWSNGGSAELLHRNSCAFGIYIGQTSCPQRFRAHILEFAPYL